MIFGMRRHIVKVEQHDGTVTNGEPDYTTDANWDAYEGLREVPASYQGVSGGEVVRGVQMESTATGLLRILSTPRTQKIKPKMRIRLGTRKLNILSVLDREGIERELFVQVKELGDA